MVFLNCTSDFGILLNKILCKFHFERVHLCSYIWHVSPSTHLTLHPHLHQTHPCPTHATLHFSLFPGHSWMSHSFVPLHNARSESTFLNLHNSYHSFQTQPSPQNLEQEALHFSVMLSTGFSSYLLSVSIPTLHHMFVRSVTRSCSVLDMGCLVQNLIFYHE